MSVKRITLAVGFALLCAHWAPAATVPNNPFGPDFNIQLDTGNGSSWDANTNFEVQGSTMNQSTTGFTENQFCPNDDWERCTCDPHVVLQGGGDPTNFDGTFTITTDEDGGADINFQNIGPDIQSILITTTNFSRDETYTCSSDLFKFCGFAISPDPTLDILFANPTYKNGIPSIPEPKQDAVLLMALGAGVMLQHIRSRRAKT